MLTPEECENLRKAFFNLEEALKLPCLCIKEPTEECNHCDLIIEARNLYRKVIGAV